jgi:hypothetical protein
MELVIRVMPASGLFLREAYLSQVNQCCRSLTVISSVQGLHLAIPPPFSSSLTDTSIKILGRAPVMPRIRGRPRRGAAWYAAESRRKRKANFERALAIATRRRKLKLRTPPPVFIEEVIPPTGPPGPTKHNPLTIPKNWNSRASYGSPGPHQPVNEEPDPSASIEEWPYTPCYVVEEIPPEATEATEDTGQER